MTSERDEMVALEDLQELDQRLDALRRQRQDLPERAALSERDRELELLRSEMLRGETLKGELSARQIELESSTEELSRRITGLRDRLYGSQPAPPRELPALHVQLGSLEEQRAALEEETLGLMERLESLTSSEPGSRVALSEATSARESALSAVAAAESEVDSEALELLHRRAEVASGVQASLISRYEALRRRLGGTALARLDGRRCSGCHLELSATQLDELRRSPGGVGTCESCGRLLLTGRS